MQGQGSSETGRRSHIAFPAATIPYRNNESGKSIRLHWRLDSGTSRETARPSIVDDTEPSDQIAQGELTVADDPMLARKRVEAFLLIARDPIPSRKLAQVARLADATQARTLVRELNSIYDSRGHAFRIEEVAGGFLMLTRPQFSRWLRKIDGMRPSEHLPQISLETLTIVAYRQPVPRATIEAIRGVGCDEVLKQLMQQDLVRICGRSEELGRPYLYGTTKRFLQLFGLKSLDRLPRSDWVCQADSKILPTPTQAIQA